MESAIERVLVTRQAVSRWKQGRLSLSGGTFMTDRISVQFFWYSG